MTAQASAGEPRVDNGTAGSPAPRSLVGELESVRKQAGSIVGGLYARAAGAFLKRLEAIEDREAQRRFRRLGKPASSSVSVTPGGRSEVEPLPSTPKTSV
jgi:hypothetical protein